MSKRGNSSKRKRSDALKLRKNSQESVPWVENFQPLTIEELAVHKKKISEVQDWIQNTFLLNKMTKDHSILILSGPTGTGKTATVEVICNTLGIEMFVWSNVHQEKTWNNEDTFSNSRDWVVPRETQAVAFSRFILQSTKYSLCSNSKKIIIVEEFPNALLRNPVEFHNIIRKYSCYSQCPIIFIISDSTRGESIENRLFPKDLQLSLKVSNISFNPIAPTMLMKVLTRINNSSKVQSSYMQLSKTELESIASGSNGDIRNAINSLQFLCMSHFKKPLAISKSKEQEPHSDCSSKRDSSLFLFHALGKILYCKRDASLKTDCDNLPMKLKKYEKDPLVSNPEDVYEKTSISAEGFTLFLQENYLDFVEDIKAIPDCSIWLSEADVISSSWSNREILNNYMVSCASRGLMFNLSPSSTGKRWRPLHKPQFYENNAKQKQLLTNLKYCFKGTNLSARELQVDLVPFLSKLHLKHLNPAQIAFSKELGEMNVKRFTRQTIKTLDEKDCFHQEIEDVHTVTDLEDTKPEETDKLETFSDEEIVIEEYDF